MQDEIAGASPVQREVRPLVGRLLAESAGYGEWRVQSPIDGAYCFAPEAREYLDPEKEARDWLAKHKRDYPNSQFASYEVKCVQVQTTADKLMQEAAADIESLKLAEEGAKEAFGHVVEQKRAALAEWSKQREQQQNT